jgi:hypothetical protein
MDIYRKPLGRWLRIPHFRWPCFFSATSDTIYLSSGPEYSVWKKRDGRMHLEQGYVCVGTDVLPMNCAPASVRRIEVKGDPRLLLPVAGPLFPSNSLPTPRSLWDILLSWGGHWMWESIQFD